MQISKQTDPVVVICDSSTVVDMSEDVHASIPWYFVLSSQEQIENDESCIQIRVIELVADVETQRSKFPSFLENGVLETQIEEHLSPDFLFGRVFTTIVKLFL